MMWFVVPWVHARTWIVDAGGAGDTTSLQAAIDAASPGDVIQVNAGTFTGPFTWSGKDLTIAGSGPGQTILAGTGTGAVLTASTLTAASQLSGASFENPGGVGLVATDVSATFRDLGWEGLGAEGTPGGGASFSGGAVWIDACSFADNLASVGGGLYLDGGAVVTITASTFSDNEATEGGAVYLGSGSALTLDTVTFRSNLATTSGGAIWSGTGATVLATASTMDNNRADTADGGALYAFDGSALTLSGSTVTGNGAGGNGGAVYLGAGSSLVDEADTWQDNIATQNGGDVFAASTNSLTLRGSTFTDAVAAYGYGGSIHAQNGLVLSATDTTWSTPYAYYGGGALYVATMVGGITLTDVGITGATAAYGHGGAIQMQSATLVVDRGMFAQNEAAGGSGGAIAAFAYVGVTVQDCTFEDNVAATSGGAVAYDAYTAGYGGFVASDSAFARNLAAFEGGALSVGTGDRTSLERSSFQDNTAGADSFGGAAHVHDNYETVARNNRFVRNQAGFGGAVYVADNVRADDTWQNNLFQENAAGTGGAGCWVHNGTSTIENNTFVGNAAEEAGGAVCLVDNGVDLRNNLFGWTSQGDVVHAYDDASVTGSRVSFNALWENAGDAVGGSFAADALQGSVVADPRVVAYTPDADADNDSLVLQPDSPLVDAGTPDLLDPDGTESDIGAYGGPFAWVEDLDADGADRLHDCDEADASVHPGAAEVWYDGTDQDCDGNDTDRDLDGVGVDEDCDDEDATIGACPADTGTTGADPAACGCNTAGSSVPFAALTLLSIRRRRCS